ncbi:heavy metal-binding domain-containing protein [Bradyrhizobium brasilense]|uniref:heavy metal-binding domain-containing protein n=1 Tax=Bradyrhizobium brasilense TaxID=1419277 RepID=UPI000B88A10E
MAETKDVALVSSGREVGQVTASACQKLTSDPLPTHDYALALLKQQARLRGGNGVMNVSYSESATSIIGNCWATVSASGTAVVN